MTAFGKLTDYNDVLGYDLPQTLERSVKLVPDKVALINGDERITYKQLDERVDALAASLQSLGIGKGDRVAIDLVNCPELLVAYFAVAKLGAVVTWTNPLYRAEEFKFQVSNSGSKAVIIHKEFGGFDYLGMLRSMRSELPDLKHVIALGGGAERDVIDFDELVKKGWGQRCRRPEIDPKNDLVMLLYTGGTTGIPKGAMQTHQNSILSSAIGIPLMDITADDVFLALLPLFHTFGVSVVANIALMSQGTIVLFPEYKPELTLQLVEAHKITIHHAAPTHVLLETSHPNFGKYNLSSLRTGLAAGAAWPVELFHRAEDMMGLHLSHAWGMAEIGGIGTACKTGDPNRNTSIGKPLVPGARARVVDPETGKDVPPGVPGELLFAGNILQGYWGRPDETAKAIDKDGFLHTGDLVTVDEQGYLRVTSRIKEVIKKGGYSINPNEIEALLCQHPRIKEACVISTPNPVLGESICACVVTRDGQPLSLKEVRDFMKDKIAAFKVPDELANFPDFPRLAGGVKLRKFGPGSIQEMATADEKRERLRR